MPSDELLLLLQPTALYERLIDRQIPPVRILQKERRFRHVIEKLLDYNQFRGKIFQRRCRELSINQ